LQTFGIADMAKNKLRTNKAARRKAGKQAPNPYAFAPKTLRAGVEKMAAYIKLLNDPCSAELTEPPYMGTGAGYLMRTRTMLSTGELSTASGGASDYLLELHPNGYNMGAPIASFGMYGYSVSPGGTLGNASAIAYPPALTTLYMVGNYRPVAGCIKVHYQGAELDRAGMVGSSIYAGTNLYSNEPIAQTALGYLGNAQRVTRLGVEPHEIRWLPSETDGKWLSLTQPATSISQWDYGGNSISLVLSGCTQGRVAIEITFVWEWTPAAQQINGGIPPVVRPPLGFTLNDVLSRIGDVVQFATSPATVGNIARVAQGVYNAVGQAKRLLTM
jgi:hypothetical protein